ncbi:MAG: RES domain-containing protein [Opitutaceae bacterium]|nr:RES domain-containing protein [Opitutaceae bacterium]
MVAPLRLWRLCRSIYADEAFSGRGAYLLGGRWSPPGAGVVYCADSRSLAAMEVLVHHIGTGVFRDSLWVQIAADVPSDLVEIPARVPGEWREPSPVASVQAFGAAWFREQRSVALRVPSSVVLGEFNYLLNPAHPEFKRVKLGQPEPFNFDPRLGK